MNKTCQLLSKDEIDSIWNHPTHLDLLEMKKSSLIPTTRNANSFLQVLPCIRRLFTIFDSICPNIYRLHCSDSLRILNEILCLTEEYLHILPEDSILPKELLVNEKSFDNFLSQLRRPSIIRQKTLPNIKTKFSCFGQGIQSNHPNNQLNQSLVFCFEITTKTISLPIHILILDPDKNPVPNDIKFINTYNQGYTRLYSCSYTPTIKSGKYQILFNSYHRKISQRCYEIFVHNSSKTSQEIPEYELEGDGYSTKVIVNSIARFRLRLKSSNQTMLEQFSISIFDPYGHTIVVQHRILSSNLLELTYQPMSIGEYKLQIFFQKYFHRECLIDIINDDFNSRSKLKAFGPGLQRAIVNLPTEFYVDLNHTSEMNHLHFHFESSYQAEIDYEQQLATVKYTPLTQEDFPIDILENAKEITSSPYIVHVENLSNISRKPKIHVKGLDKQIILHRTIEFQVYIDYPFDDSTHTLHIDLITENDLCPPITIRRHHQSSYTCSFTPIDLGRYLISIDYAGIVAEHNPFFCQCIQEKDILLTGPAINNQCLRLHQPTYFSFSLQDFFDSTYSEKSSTYESGYSSNDDLSSKSSSLNDIRMIQTDEEKNYHVTITNGQGHVKPNVYVQEIMEKSTDNQIRVDFTPDEKILYINISCTW